MIEQIYDRAKHGGKKAVAAPRGRGKSEITKGMLVFVVLAELVRFPLVICATTGLSEKIYKDFRTKFATNELLLADFPEVCCPIRDLEGAPLRAYKQHIDGALTKIAWKATELRFPDVPGSPYGGVKMDYYGLDAAFRGLNVEGDRPDFVLIDDPETRESAKSITQIEDRETIIDQDISGMEGQDKSLAIVVLTTVQNRYCLSFKLTDPKLKPAFDGVRFGWVVLWPNNMDLWEDYIAKRNADQAGGDRYGRGAATMYRENRKAMDEGVEMLADNYKEIILDDGTELVHSAIQEAFNKIADTSMAAFRTEYQNDPEPEEETETLGLTAGRVQSRLSKFRQGEVASDVQFRTLGLDIGKYNSHWTDTAWQQGASGSVVDYGIMETYGLTPQSDDKAIELALVASLETFADEVVSTINPALCLIDAGKYSEGIYEFCRRRGKPFFPSKGWDAGRFRIGKRSSDRVPFWECYASRLIESGVWLYNVNTEWWKRWLQERFMVHPFAEDGSRNDGSLTLFDPAGDAKRHLSFSHHITAEEEQLVPVHGKELKRVWFVKNRNNHWLDATALACSAAGCLGMRLIKPAQTPPRSQAKQYAKTRPTTPYGRPFVATSR